MRKCVLLLLFTFMAPLSPGCSMKIPMTPDLEPLRPVKEPRPVSLKKVVARVSRGTRIGDIYGGLAHLKQRSLVWKGGRVSFDTYEFEEVLRDEFEAAGYPVAGDPDSLFDDEGDSRAEYLIGAAIKDIKMNLSYPGSGEAYLDVEWQIYGRRSRSVELKAQTTGSAKKVNIYVGPSEPMLQAFAQATRNLLADSRFRDLVAPDLSSIGDRHLEPIEVAIQRAIGSAPSVENLLTRSRLSVLTVFAGDGHGSGFVVSKDGYVLTNQHVVRDARVVTVKTVTGRELVGEVIRSDKSRDVALIKLEEDLYQPLPVGNSAKLALGNEVYAIGSPRDEELGQSVSKGIISGFRNVDDQRLIQSDVAINPGNSGGPLLTDDGLVVGIAVQGLRESEGINFFIPIEDALAALAITEPK